MVVIVSLPISFAPMMLGASLADTFLLIAQMFMAGILLAMFVILANGAQHDMKGGDCEKAIVEIVPQQKTVRLEQCIAVMTTAASLTVYSKAFLGGWLSWTVIFRLGDYANLGAGDLAYLWLVCVCLAVFNFVLIHLFSFCFRQSRVFCEWAETTSIDLLEMEQYQVFSHQPMRFLLVTVLFLSANLIIFEFLKQGSPLITLILVQLPLVLAILLFLIFVMRPVLIIRRRIALAKSREIIIIKIAILGDRSQLQGSQIRSVANEFKAPDLMQYLDRIEGIWEWPVQGNVQRLTLYGLLPPVAWILAALVERGVDLLL
ncbi:MAG: hypothetical protein HN816_10315 [Gammaproteobacteria bacterium]|nr:hypothetical protein [Gammaproteobacteria bacterium]